MNTDDDDISDFIKAKSDQLNADDLVGGPITVRIEGFRNTGGEQPLALEISGGHKPWKPCKTTMRILAALWGTKASAYVGRMVTLYRDATVTFGKVEVGGIRISGMSHIDGPKKIMLSKSKAVKAEHRIDVIRVPAQTQQRAAPPPQQTNGDDATTLRATLTDRLAKMGAAPSHFADWLKENHPDLAGKTMPPVGQWKAASLAWALRQLDGEWGERFKARHVKPADDAGPDFDGEDDDRMPL